MTHVECTDCDYTTETFRAGTQGMECPECDDGHLYTKEVVTAVREDRRRRSDDSLLPREEMGGFDEFLEEADIVNVQRISTDTEASGRCLATLDIEVWSADEIFAEDPFASAQKSPGPARGLSTTNIGKTPEGSEKYEKADESSTVEEFVRNVKSHYSHDPVGVVLLILAAILFTVNAVAIGLGT